MEICWTWGTLDRCALLACTEAQTRGEAVLMNFQDLYVLVYPSTSPAEVLKATDALGHMRKAARMVEGGTGEP